MTCEEVKALLVDYLDKSLDTATTTRVATHLISCASCGSEAGDVADCITQVADLPNLDPPLGFTQRVMAHVYEMEPKTSFWQRLVSPWSQWSRLLPLQTAALVMVGIVGIYLYHADDQLKQRDLQEIADMRPAPMPSDPVKPAAKSTPAAAPQLVDKKAPQPESKTAAKASLSKDAKVAKPHVRDQISSVNSQLETRQDENKLAKRPPIRVQEASNPSEAVGFPSGGAFVPALPVGGFRQPAPPSLPMALERMIPLGERDADYEFVVRRRSAQRRELADGMELDAHAKSDQTEQLARPMKPATVSPRIESIAEIRFYRVAPEHFEYFKQELASEAIIEAQSKLETNENDLGRFERQLLIKVTILPPSTAQPTSSPR